MKKQLTPQQRAYRDGRDRKVINMIAPFGLIGIGTWMVLSPGKPEHRSIEKATTALVKDIWGMEAGIVLLVLGAIWFIFAFRGYKKYMKSTPKPQ